MIMTIFFPLSLAHKKAAGAFFAYQRYQAGADAAFSQGIAEDEMGGGGDDYPGGYAAAAAADGGDLGYNEPPFGGGGQTGKR